MGGRVEEVRMIASCGLGRLEGWWGDTEWGRVREKQIWRQRDGKRSVADTEHLGCSVNITVETAEEQPQVRSSGERSLRFPRDNWGSVGYPQRHVSGPGDRG